MDAMNTFFGNNQQWLVLISIPIISAFVGWITNIIALKMTFYPLEFVGIWKPYLGWQGIIPMKAAVMAERSVELTTTKLISIQDQFSRMDPEQVAHEMKDAVEQFSKQIINESMMREMPVLWSAIPSPVKEIVYNEAKRELPKTIELLFDDLQDVIEEVLDLKKMTVDTLVANKELLNRTFLEVGDAEFEFIERSGFYFGGIFGIIQMIVWYGANSMGYDIPWILPTGGLLVGWLTNVLALKLIFSPLHPKKIFGFTVQGLFIKRQKEVSEAYAKIVTEEIVTTENMFRTIFQGAKKDLVMDISEKHVRQAIEEAAGYNKTLISLTKGDKSFENIKEYVAEGFVDFLPTAFTQIFPYMTAVLDIENTMKKRMSELPPEEFEGFLRPVFQEDEWKLIAAGAVLGGLAGCFQLWLTLVAT